MIQEPKNKAGIDPSFLAGPIPGMSLTTEPGNRPWENPPQMVTLEEVVSYYSDKLLNSDNTDLIVQVLESGISIESIAEHMTLSAVMDGLHTIDLSILVNPVIRELIKYVAEVNEIDYIESYEDAKEKDKLPRSQVSKIVKQEIKKSKKLPPEIMEVQKKAMELAKSGGQPMAPSGLMARQTKPMMEGA